MPLVDDPLGIVRRRPAQLPNFRAQALSAYLESLEAAGVNHVALNLQFDSGQTDTTLHRLADTLIPRFGGHR